jgi:renalase
MKKVAIIGAGLSGLILANKLQNFFELTVFEKSRGVGGRISTRYATPYEFDHGAQFFIAKDPIFKDFVKELLEAKVIARWDASFVEIDGTKIKSSRMWGKKYPHYVGVPKMNALARYLSQNLNILLNTRISSIEKERKWVLHTQDGQSFADFDLVILATPPEQAAVIMPKVFQHQNILESIQMLPCYSLLLGFEQDLNISWQAAHVSGEDISWISVNNSKPARVSDFSLVILSTNKWAGEHVLAPPQFVIDELRKKASKVMGVDLSGAIHVDLQRWLYANINRTNLAPLYDEKNQLAACGDWCERGVIEGAFLAAHKLANHIIKEAK